MNIERRFYHTERVGGWTAETVGDCIKEMIETEKLLPGHRPMGYRSFMPEVAPRYRDGEAEQKTLHEGFLRPYADNAAIDRYDQVQRWLTWLRLEERRIVLCWATGVPDYTIARRVGKHRSTVKRYRIRALRAIARKLNAVARQAA